MYHKNNKQVILGDIGELIAQYYVTKIKNEIITEQNNYFRYDFKTNNDSSYEIKLDRKYIEYNNIFIEITSKMLPSGITTTESSNYIYICPLDDAYEKIKVFEFKTHELKQLLTNNKCPVVSTKYIDYGGNITCHKTTGYIVPKKLFKHIAITNTIIKTEETINLYENINKLLFKIINI